MRQINFKVLWDETVAMISSLLPQYSLLTGKLVGPAFPESALGPRVMGSLK